MLNVQGRDMPHGEDPEDKMPHGIEATWSSTQVTAPSSSKYKRNPKKTIEKPAN